MTMRSVSITIPETIIEYTLAQDEKTAFTRNAMILYPFIQNETISHGKAAQLLGVHKLDLIALYSSLGLNYLDQSEEELQNDIATLQSVCRKAV